MVPSRNGPKGADVASFGLATLVFLLTPTQAGHQDLAALLAQQPSVTARWRDHLAASPFGTIHAATFSMPRPIGTAIPESPLVRLASLSTDITGSTGDRSSALRRSPPPPHSPDSPLRRPPSLSTDITGPTGDGSFAIRRSPPQAVFPEINRTNK